MVYVRHDRGATSAPSRPRSSFRIASRFVAAVAVAAIGFIDARAEQLPLRVFTTEDGLAHNRVKGVAQSPDGFLWFFTTNGLSRFDGRSFVSYGVEDGLPVPSVNDVLQVEGGMWVATNGGGIAFFDPRAVVPRFRAIAIGEGAANRVNRLASAGAGRLWAATDAGLFSPRAGTPATR